MEGRGATAEEAAAWVEYCNGDAHSKYGSMRSANGSPEPFHVRYWEIGNEIWGNWVRGHSDAQTYAKNLNRYVEKMKAVDPSITIIATGDNDLKWNETVLKLAGKNIDYLSVHSLLRSRRDGKVTQIICGRVHCTTSSFIFR